jgi:RNA polymerase sigma factor (sigma-70 family)
MDFANTTETAAACEADSDRQFTTELLGLARFLRAFSLQLCGRNLGEDMAQETLTKAWKARRSYQAGTQMKAWLFTILRNEYRSHLRRSWRQVAWDEDAAENIATPPLQQHWQSELSDVRRALPCLPAEQREALLLITVGALTYDQAAAVTSTPVGTVKSRVGRARAKLVKLLDGEAPRKAPPQENVHGALRPADSARRLSSIIRPFQRNSKTSAVS